MSPSVKQALNKAIRTFLIATAGIAIPGLLGWLNDLTAWARSNGTTPMPDAHGLLFLAVSAVTAGFIAVLHFVIILVENGTGKAFLREPLPKQPKGQHEAGVVTLGVLEVCLLVMTVVVVLWWFGVRP